MTKKTWYTPQRRRGRENRTDTRRQRVSRRGTPGSRDQLKKGGKKRSSRGEGVLTAAARERRVSIIRARRLEFINIDGWLGSSNQRQQRLSNAANEPRRGDWEKRRRDSISKADLTLIFYVATRLGLLFIIVKYWAIGWWGWLDCRSGDWSIWLSLGLTVGRVSWSVEFYNDFQQFYMLLWLV